jgi:hypothetical protein
MEYSYNLIFDEIRQLINKAALMWMTYTTGVSLIIALLYISGILPLNALWSLLWIIPNAVALVFLVRYYHKKAMQLAKKQQISMMAYHAKQVIDDLNQQFPDTYISDCSVKLRYLEKHGIDVDAALNRLDNNSKAYNELAMTFLRESDRWEDELYDLLHATTLMQYASKAHALRIKAYELGLTNMTDTAFFHEIEAYAGSYDVLRDNWKKLSFEFDEAYDILSEYIRSLNLTDDMTFKMWGERLQEAFHALETYDTIKAKQILSELIKYQINSDVTNTLQSIIKSIDEY